MGNLLATPSTANYRRTLSGTNRVNAIKQLDNESIDLFYILYIYFVLVLCCIAVIYLYSIKSEGIPRFAGDKAKDARGELGLWTRFIRWLQETPASRRCATRSCPTISIPPENQPTEPSTNLCGSASNNDSIARDCII